MNEFDIYTIGSGFYLEKILNAIKLIIDGKENFGSIMKLSSIIALFTLAIKAGINNDFKSAIKWFLSVTILVGLFLTTRATVHIHDKLPDSYGFIAAPRTVTNVPLGLAIIGSTTSQVGNLIAEKFDIAFAGVFNNPDYQKTGLLFGSKIIDDIGKLRIHDPKIKQFMFSFYKSCIVPDARMGYNRKNGYILKDLVDTDNLIEFLKDHSSKARMVHFPSELQILRTASSTHARTTNFAKDKIIENYTNCNNAAHYIGEALNVEVEERIQFLATSFITYFMPDKKKNNQNEIFKSVLENSYGIFIRKSSKQAKDILLQNIMINAIGDNVDAYSKAYGRVTSEEMTKSAYYSVAQIAQKFVPILRAVLECLFYGVFPLILILMVTPIGMDVLKNYGFGFIYLQLWQPMYAILFCIAASWGKLYASNIDDITFATHLRIGRINDEISAISGYMLSLVPVLSLFITKGMVSNIGNLASSIFYIPQSTAVQSAEQAVKGNYQIGNTSIDTHSYNNNSGNKYDDNYSWMSGMKSFGMQSGATEKIFGDGRSGIDSSGAISNLAGLARVDWNKAVGSRFDQSINEQMSRAERASSNMVESASSGYSKMLGFDENFSRGSSDYQSWNKGLSSEQRSTFDEASNFVTKFAEDHGISQQDALKIAVAGNLNFGFDKSVQDGAFAKLTGNIVGDASTSASKDTKFGKLVEASKNAHFAENLNKIENATKSSSYQEGNSTSKNMITSAKEDFAQFQNANLEISKSMDKVHSLQESKSSFEQNSSNISQDLSNKFSEVGINAYGAAGFEEIIRNNPEKTNQILNNFIDNTIPKDPNHLNIQNEFINKKTKFAEDFPNEIRSNHQDNQNILESSYQDNNHQKHTKDADQFQGSNFKSDFENNMNQYLEKSIESKKAVEENLTDTDLEMHNKLEKQQIAEYSLIKKVDINTNKSASGTLVDSWNPLNKDHNN